MLIQEALKATGKARPFGVICGFAMKNEKGHLLWFNGDGAADGYATLSAILQDNWQPYREVEEIRPEKEGELWQSDGGNIFFTYMHKGELYHIFGDGSGGIPIRAAIFGENVIHGTTGMCGWNRIYPSVEDNSVETIEIEDVLWNTTENHTYPFQEKSSFDWDQLLNMKPIKLICVIPKEEK
jgi:hypothetical protein